MITNGIRSVSQQRIYISTCADAVPSILNMNKNASEQDKKQKDACRLNKTQAITIRVKKEDKKEKTKDKGAKIKPPRLCQWGESCIEPNPGYTPCCPLDEPNGRMGWG